MWEIKPCKSPVPDGTYLRVLKEFRYEIADLLRDIRNLSQNSATYPEVWRIANVTPVLKMESREELGNYRIVSLM